jgi:hypothetical protein
LGRHPCSPLAVDADLHDPGATAAHALGRTRGITMPNWSKLLQDHSPLLVYDSRETYFADAASSFVGNAFDAGPGAPYRTRLMRKGRELQSVSGTGLTLDSLSERYSERVAAHEDDYLVPGPEPAADARRLHQSAEHANVIYGHVAPRKAGGRWLQYWFFYFMSAKGIPGIRSATGPLGFGLHEGDWEMIQIAVPEDGGTPVAASYAAHDHAHSVPWDEVEIDPGTGAPVVYVALDSHASYPRDGRWRGKKVLGVGLDVLDDWCDAGGLRVRPAVREVDEKTTPWLRWPGRWGSTDDGIRTRSPRGPACQDKWRRPDHMHENATPWRERWAGRAADLEGIGAEPAGPPFAVTVARDGGHVTVSFDVPPGLEDEWAGQLTRAVNSAEGPPVARVYDVTVPGVQGPG